MDHGDVDHGDMDADVKLLTLQGIMAFMVMFGLVGLALSRQSGFGALFSLLGALVAGVAAMWVIGKIFTLAMRLRSSGTVVNTSAIGQGGTVYLNIPAGGQGKVHVVVQNRLREFEAISHGDDAIKTGEKVRVVAVKDGRIMVVERIATAEGKGE
jgi:membrane-bound ClpP family serine protease